MTTYSSKPRIAKYTPYFSAIRDMADNVTIQNGKMYYLRIEAITLIIYFGGNKTFGNK